MLTKILLIVFFACSVLTRNVPSFNDLDEEDQMLFRAAYDPSYETPYNTIEYPEVPTVKLDLLKDGMSALQALKRMPAGQMWALKAKLKEMKAFNKALAANLLSTKLKVKELLAHHMKPIKKHQHVEVDKKPVVNYQPHSPQPTYPHYEQSEFTPPQTQYTPSHPQYTPSQTQYTPPHSQHSAPQAQHYTTEYEYDPYHGY